MKRQIKVIFFSTNFSSFFLFSKFPLNTPTAYDQIPILAIHTWKATLSATESGKVTIKSTFIACFSQYRSGLSDTNTSKCRCCCRTRSSKRNESYSGPTACIIRCLKKTSKNHHQNNTQNII